MSFIWRFPSVDYNNIVNILASLIDHVYTINNYFKAGKPLTLDLPVFAIAVIVVVGAIAVILLVVIFTACIVVCIRKKTPPKEEKDLYDVPESPPPPPSSPHTITLPMSRNVRRLPMASNIAYGISSRK